MSDADAPDAARPPLGPLVRVVWEKQVAHLLCYPLNTLSLFASMFVFFCLVFFGGRAVAGGALSGTADGLVVGFFLWTTATRAFRGLADRLMEEARWGTLERLFVSPYGFGTVVGVETAVTVLLSAIWGAAMLVPMMLVTGRWLHVGPLTLLPLLVSTLLSVAGVGLALGGLAVRYKRVENLFGLATFGLAGLVAAPVGDVPALGLLPMAQGSYLVRTSMTRGVPLWRLPVADLAVLAGVTVASLLGGAYCLRVAQRRARERGVLGHY